MCFHVNTAGGTGVSSSCNQDSTDGTITSGTAHLPASSTVRKGWTKTGWSSFDPSDSSHWLGGRVSGSEGWLDFCCYMWLRPTTTDSDCISLTVSSVGVITA